jgi:phage host-nuclease inhibitor protein Gam
MQVDKELLLALTRQLLDIKDEKKKIAADYNDQVKDIEKQITKLCKE